MLASACKACRNAGPPVLTAEYIRKGTIVDIGDLEVYLVGAGDKCIVLICDIFGFDFPQVFQVCDRLADAGFSVIAPDVFHGKPWPMEKFPPPPEGMPEWIEWMTVTFGWPKLKPEVSKCVYHMKAKFDCKKFGAIGFCWGAFMAFQAAHDQTFSAVAGCHPSMFNQEQAIAGGLQCPVCVISTKDDPLETIKEVMDKKPFHRHCFYKRYDDQVHGFLAARGEWEKPEVAKAATDALGHVAKFFKKTL